MLKSLPLILVLAGVVLLNSTHAVQQAQIATRISVDGIPKHKELVRLPLAEPGQPGNTPQSFTVPAGHVLVITGSERGCSIQPDPSSPFQFLGVTLGATQPGLALPFKAGTVIRVDVPNANSTTLWGYVAKI